LITAAELPLPRLRRQMANIAFAVQPLIDCIAG